MITQHYSGMTEPHSTKTLPAKARDYLSNYYRSRNVDTVPAKILTLRKDLPELDRANCSEGFKSAQEELTALELFVWTRMHFFCDETAGFARALTRAELPPTKEKE